MSIADTLLLLERRDTELRQQLIREGRLGDGYHPAMERLHDANAGELRKIIAEIGYPTAAKVGPEASRAAWVVVQHAIGHPALLRRCATLLAEAVNDGEADPLPLAYLTDRIAVREGRPQRYGTQFDWDESGQLSPNPCDDPDRVAARRLSLGLPSLAEATATMRQRSAAENDGPPTDAARRHREYQQWRYRVGWAEEA